MPRARVAQAAPQVEAEYQDLDRGYNVLRKNYEELLARREASKITAAADIGADKMRLRVVDPPQMPSLPIAPNRFLLLSVALLAGFGAAAGIAVLLSQLDHSVADVAKLRELGVPVLGGISIIPFLMARTKLYSQTLPIVASILILFIVYGGLAGQVLTHHKVLF